jgi:hypothetical protein
MIDNLTCAMCRDRLPDYMTDLLDHAECTLIDTHLNTCAACRAEAEQWRAIRLALRHRLERVAPQLSHEASWQNTQFALSGSTVPSTISSHRRLFMTQQCPVEIIEGPPPAVPPIPRPQGRISVAFLAAVAVIAVAVLIFGVFPTHNTFTPGAAVAQAASATPGSSSPISAFGLYKQVVTNPGNGSITFHDPASQFSTSDTIYAAMNVGESARVNDVISIKWYFNGVNLTDKLKHEKIDCCSMTISANGKRWQVYFLLAVPKAGDGKVEIYYNNALVDTANFSVTGPDASPPPQSTTPLTNVIGIPYTEVCGKLLAAHAKCGEAAPAGAIVMFAVPPGN